MLPGFTSVISAAVVSGDLIIGLSDGSQINCGRVQGPQGLRGDAGPVGAPGTPGAPGNTIHTVRGTPEGWLGRDGDFAINTALWEIYGPRSGGVWGSPTPLRGNLRNGAPKGVDLFGSNPSAPANPNGGVMQTTRTLPLANPTTRSAKNLPDTSGLTNQEGFNKWTYDALEALSNGIPPSVDLSNYATIEYVDEADVHLQGLISTAQTTASDAARKAEANEQAIAAIDIPEAPNLDNYATKSDLSVATSNLPYRLETDKTIRDQNLPGKVNAQPNSEPTSAGGEIQLVDALGYFHNVTFTGRHGVTTESTAAGIVVDAASLSNRIEQLENTVQQLITLIPPVDIGEVTITSSVDLPDGGATAQQEEMFIMTCNNSGTTQHGLRYSWSIKRGAGRISGSDNQQVCTAWCTDPPPSTVEFQCVVSHPAQEETVIATWMVLVSEGE